MNNFHRYQKFQQFSNFLIFFSQIRLMKRHTSLFCGICREIRTQFHEKLQNLFKNTKFDAENEKNGNLIIQ